MTRRAAFLLIAGWILLAAPSSAQQQGAAALEVPDSLGNTAHAAGAEASAAAEASELEPIELTPEQEERARRLEGIMKCPVCRSQSVRSSDSFMAKDMQRKIRELVSEGESDEEIVAYFTERYGDWILLSPPKSGFTWAAWLLPFAVVLAGAIGLVVAARRWSRRPKNEGGTASVESPPPESPYLDRLERELEESE